MTLLVALIAFAAVLPLTVLATGWLQERLRRAAVLDRPNERSSHTVPTPRGGGLAVMAVLLPAWAAIGLADPVPELWIVLAAALPLVAVSWLDDVRTLSPLVRLLVQLGAVAAGLFALPDGLVLQGLVPFWADRLLVFLAWVWFVNLYNFMDGIDGITGVETAMLGLGITVLGSGAEPALALAVVAAALGFLRWNWAPARIFLGDVGSVPLGFLLGWLLLTLAARGQWAAAAILPAYYLADATLTLTRRMLRGEKPWRAHREHFYQKAARGLGRHAPVSLAILGANAALLVLAVAAQAAPWPAVAGAAAVVTALLFTLARMAHARP